MFIHKLKNGIRAEGIENWLPLFYPNELCNIVDFFNIEAIFADENFLNKTTEKIKYIYDLYEEKKKLEEIESENINGTLHPDEFYLSYSRLQYIYKSDTFKELKYFSDISEGNSFNIQCQQES